MFCDKTVAVKQCMHAFQHSQQMLGNAGCLVGFGNPWCGAMDFVKIWQACQGQQTGLKLPFGCHRTQAFKAGQGQSRKTRSR